MEREGESAVSRWHSRFGLPVAMVAAAAVVLGTAGSAAVAAPPAAGLVKVTELGTLPGGHGSGATAVNKGGQVVGTANTAAGKEHAVVWSPTGQGTYAIADLGALPGGDFSVAEAISPNGLVAGTAQLASQPNATTDVHAPLWRPTGSRSYRVTDLGKLPGSYSSSAFAVNADGVVAGASSTDTGDHALAWSPGADGSCGMAQLGTLSGDRYSYAYGINAGGMIAGYSGGPDHGHAVVWRPIGQGSYSVTDLGVLPDGAYSYARTITDEGVVAGESYLSETDIHAVVWRPSGQGSYSITDLGALPGSLSSSAYGVNAGGRDRRLLRLPGAARSDPPRAVTWTRTAAGSYTISELPVPPGDSDRAPTPSMARAWRQVTHFPRTGSSTPSCGLGARHERALLPGSNPPYDTVASVPAQSEPGVWNGRRSPGRGRSVAIPSTIRLWSPERAGGQNRVSWRRPAALQPGQISVYSEPWQRSSCQRGAQLGWGCSFVMLGLLLPAPTVLRRPSRVRRYRTSSS